ncbi:MAG TPA: dephospho-CoA kinase [Candidatus Binatia bacterium]|nr:dephospho-CoA kinase [Candidatus Binatia bacterium]
MFDPGAALCETMLRVALTGGVASGKTTVAGMLARQGAHCLHADALAHRLYAPGAPAYDEVVRHFGREILDEDGTVNRARLANVVFPDRIHELNAIVHPAVIEAQRAWMAEVGRKDPGGVAVVEAALVIEAGAEKDFDCVVVVTCGAEQKVEHYMERTGVSRQTARAEVERRSRAQLGDEEKARHADYVIDNSGSLAHTEQQVEKIWSRLLKLAADER